ncbi:bifunctional diaminohydroxyphosphoribosylaminopyrimidine deaminase/5-amino-6-(5-phosphoribosylamino)uracil reductase RibD [Acanthopleuribacter pedis]|uniref:Riboflavin biosynthesis protein RibD n=1 Tax=Acanthopleuribacter pedis TaxID=442870 RepID=A0A8J7QH16_9BACT|nr:bifunctional diaminohydroxyphosphoribosylaminopyrimidine deaminase/5-amino-6-(5-phosphoribosylamino)uracil reductase RibD [Acanthopleuribacter pedis]MBO1320216.1 bifunctional diaminohydroxyphosphoribosylaminopyrimidine deaminase/5-amino-6-(5-phosphoribosylamino)uracil reductase RibD [Acanthopleuribacter pedis]
MTLPKTPAPKNEPHLGFMARALELARRADGFTAPNPMVGAVIVRDGRIIGEGYHHRAGLPHAEIEALRSASEDVRGATMYVTLEPCCHHGRTPPCSQALVDAGIGTVFYAVGDDNPKVEGGGHRQLVEAGVTVFCGPFEDEARYLNRAFFHMITQKQPYVFAKYAMSLDGRIATRTGSSQWITGPAARAEAHRLRQSCDGILVGAGTVIADNPSLTTRLNDRETCAHPVRIILDSRGRCPLEARVFDPQLEGNTLVVAAPDFPSERRRILADRGVDVLTVPLHEQRLDVRALLPMLAERGMLAVMVEGGAEVLGSFAEHGLINEIWAFIGGKVIGGVSAPGPIGGLGLAEIGDAHAWYMDEVARVGEDVVLKARRRLG